MNQTASFEILFREEFCDGLVCYTIKCAYNKVEHVKIRDGQADGCTCRNKKHFNECPHQEALVKLEAEYQSH